VPLPPAFYDRDALDVAYDLVGCTITHGPVTVRISEVEAYRFPGDTANHARMGRTRRNAPMWGPPGHAYVYLCYGLHQMLNLVTGPEGHAAAVLIRGAEPIEGLALIRTRRGGLDGPALMDGPGKVGAALGLTSALSGTPLDGPIVVEARGAAPDLVVGPRIGIGYADPADQAAPWRVALAGSRWVGRRAALRPRGGRLP
jgi:DNA-3-methyladenine glycosylase